MLQITLDENECFSAWVSAKDGGLDSPSGSDAKRQSLLPSGAFMDNIADYNKTWGLRPMSTPDLPWTKKVFESFFLFRVRVLLL